MPSTSPESGRRPRLPEEGVHLLDLPSRRGDRQSAKISSRHLSAELLLAEKADVAAETVLI